MAILKGDRVVLIKEYNNRLNTVGETYEVASLTDIFAVIRDANTKVALGTVNHDEFKEYFKLENEVKKSSNWTPWTKFDVDNGEVAFYRTNYRKVEVRHNGVKTTSSCNLKEDEFNLYFGIRIAYLRCQNKFMMKRKEKNLLENKMIDSIVKDNTVLINKMVASLEKKEEKVEE